MKKSEHKTEIKNCFSAYRYNMMQWKETNQVARDAFIKDADKHPRYHYLHIASCCSEEFHCDAYLRAGSMCEYMIGLDGL